MRDFLLTIACLFLMATMAAMSCVGLPPVDALGDMSRPADLAEDRGIGGGSGRGGGYLPPGYNQRGCQWDGCQPPPANEAQPLIIFERQ